ncbi:MAG: chemotaxis protein CheB [Deferrisomatales bacterium]|nr:chemotaxis protein CheB [Deferrisomatales bacterium]
MTRRAKQSGPANPPSASPESPVPGDAFPVVGLGASAGGLEALEQFLDHAPADSGMAFVVVQHLDPTHKGALPELLQRRTRMQVSQVEEGMRVEPNRVYVIPPNRDLFLEGGTLRLLEPAEPRGLRLPIDSFFRSLARDLEERAIGVILSGMGSDGTLGLRAIKENAGLTLVQDPGSAKYDSMPRSAIDAGIADFVAPAQELPVKLLASFHGTLVAEVEDQEAERKSPSALEKIVALLRARTGRDFAPYKRSTISRRVERRMGIHQLRTIARYADFLHDNPQELALLSRELLIGVTSFFRDPKAFAALREKALPALLASRPAGRVFRVWVPACATGEEAYSLAMLLKEALEERQAAAGRSGGDRVQVFATDLDPDAVARARQGAYPEGIAADVSPERLRRFFVKEGGAYRVAKELRDTVVFAPHNVITDPPFTKLDLLSCRNLLIYLTADVQKKLLPLFHYSLNPEGILFLGSAETAGGFPDLFSPIDPQAKLYRRRPSSAAARAVEFPSSYAPSEDDELGAVRGAPRSPGAGLQELVDGVLLREFGPPCVLVDERGDLLYVHGRTGKYLEPAAGKANLNLFAMAREGLRHPLWSAVQKAQEGQEPVRCKGLRVKTNGTHQRVDVTVKPLGEPQALRGLLLVLFEEVAAPRRRSRSRPAPSGGVEALPGRVEELERELQQSREYLQTTQEEMQTSQEELKSANEELQSTNEELQSTNEELTTSKEEMQSLNEELLSVNTEMQAKIEELSRTSNDMKNLLNSTDIATLFLDNDLNVRRFTGQTTRIIKLIPSDVGRPITDIVSDLSYPGLADDVRDVLETLAFQEREVATVDGRWFQVRILPYRTYENRIDGVVLTFSDITVAKQLEQALRDAQQAAQQRIETLESAVTTKGEGRS